MSDKAVSAPITEANPNELWRNYTKNVAISACTLNSRDLKRLYRILNEKQIALGQSLIDNLIRNFPMKLSKTSINAAVKERMHLSRQ